MVQKAHNFLLLKKPIHIFSTVLVFNHTAFKPISGCFKSTVESMSVGRWIYAIALTAFHNQRALYHLDASQVLER